MIPPIEKLTHILAVVEHPEHGESVIDKSVALARRFDARVELLLADAHHGRRFLALCLERGYTEVFLSSAHRGTTPLHEVILRRVDFGHPDLVVKSPAARHAQDADLSSADWVLASQSAVPILLARENAWAEPPRLAVALDVRDAECEQAARARLQAAEFLARGCRGHVDMLYSESERDDQALRMRRGAQLATLIRECRAGRDRLQMYEGEAAQRLPPLIAARHYDIVVVGTEGMTQGWIPTRSALSHELAMATKGDILLVHAAPDAGARFGAWRPGLRRDECADETQ